MSYAFAFSNPAIENLCQIAIGHLKRNELGDAIIGFTEVLKQDPTCDLAWHNRGIALRLLGHPFDAMMNVEYAIKLRPAEANYMNTLALCWADMDKIDKTILILKQALNCNKGVPEIHRNLGNMYRSIGDAESALKCYEEAVRLNPNDADAHVAQSLMQLLTGDYKNGWREFEWRWKNGQMPPRGLPFKEWNGEALDGKSILIYSEQGFGDALHFVRYAEVVKNRYPTAKVYVEVRFPLKRIIKTCPGIDEVLIFGEKVPYMDYMVAMLSVPRIVGTTVKTIPWSGPYFHASEHLTGIWRDRFKKLPGAMKVGVVWAGMSRPGQPQADAIDKRRSTTLKSFAPLAAVRNVGWVCLQKGPPLDQVKDPPAGMVIGEWDEDVHDFYDTAAMIEACDLVITVDTSVVHLAGGLGKPTWLLSRFDGCWRWLGNREDSPWYPSLRQFVQPKPNDWDSLMKTVAVELNNFVKEKTK